MNFVNISAMNRDFYVKFHVTVKQSDKVCIFLLSSCVKFMQKFTRFAKISTEVTGGVLFIFIPYMITQKCVLRIKKFRFLYRVVVLFRAMPHLK